MRLAPIILRELRAESRKRLSYYLRLAGAVWSFTWLWFGLPVFTMFPDQGSRIFSSLSLGLFSILWIASPLATADCLSSERRQGTLPLLFLAPLGPMDIVLAKGSVHMIRLVSIWMASLPVLLIPAILGGVTWMDGLRALMIQFSALLIGVACGLAASAVCTNSWIAILLALLASLGLGLTAAISHGLARTAVSLLLAGQPVRWPDLWDRSTGYFQERLLKLPFWEIESKFSSNYGSTAWGPASSPVDFTGIMLASLMILTAILGSFLAVRFASNVLRRRTFLKEPGPMAKAWHRAASEARFGIEALKRRRDKALQKNPLGWLGRHSWKWRLARWGICLAVCVIEAGLLLLTTWQENMDGQRLLFMGLCFALASAAASGFRLEIQTGIMELLLISPLPVLRIALGRLRSIASFAAPSCLVLLICWGRQLPGMDFGELSIADREVVEYLFAILAICLIPMLGLWMSMRSWKPVLTIVLTLLLGVGSPAAWHLLVVHDLLELGETPRTVLMVPIVIAIHLGMAAIILKRIAWELANRRLACAHPQAA